MSSRHLLLSVAAALLLQGCTTLKQKMGTYSQPLPPAGTLGPSGTGGTTADASMLLGMSFDEAALIAPQHVDVVHLPKVAADTIEVLRKGSDGLPRKVRAKGKVFVQLDQIRALCDEALVSDDELILRGHPILQRGTSTVEGLSDVTVFYLFGQKLRVIGRHRLTNLGELAGASPWQNNSGSASLLPPLESADVPEAVRNEMRKAADAEMQLQRSRVGQPAAFPEATGAAALPPPASGAAKPDDSTAAKKTKGT